MQALELMLAATPAPPPAPAVTAGGVGGILGGIAGLIVALTGLLVQLRRVSPENVAALKRRLRASERDNEKHRRALLFANARIFRLEQILASHGWMDDETDPNATLDSDLMGT